MAEQRWSTPTSDVAPAAAPPASKPAGDRAPAVVQQVPSSSSCPGFGSYATWAALQGRSYQVGPYLSPFYSPEIWTTGPISSAIWILWIPLLFRATCYYYRKSYYRAFFWDPPACAISEPRRGRYGGETVFPWVFSNLHRFFLYLSILVLAVLVVRRVGRLHVPGPPLRGAGFADPPRERDLPLPVRALLPLAPPSARRQRRLLLLRGGRYTRYGLWSRLSQLKTPWPVCLAELVLRALRRRVHSFLCCCRRRA